MAKDPAFLFYPGDYLRDTQTLSEKTQVAYDRIMCEHMRNICISKQQLKFFTKKLSEDEIEELLYVLTEVNGGYQIEWVAESINKRKAYSESRRKNRSSKSKKDKINISETYVEHMENENEIENKEENKEGESEREMIQFQWPEIKTTWNRYKEMRKEAHRFKFHDELSEQRKIRELEGLSNGPDQAIEILERSITEKWKGFWKPEKNKVSALEELN